MLDKALGETRGPLAIAEECLLQREKRLGIDLVRDDVECQLTREVDLIKKCQRKMKETIERAEMQLK
jgi:tektin-3